MTDYATRIHCHLEHYYCEHYGKLPEAIFMSYRLYRELAVSLADIMIYSTPNGTVETFHHVPIRVYSSDKFEYYLAESGGEFD